MEFVHLLCDYAKRTYWNAILVTFVFLFFFNQSHAQQSYGISTCSGIQIDFKQPGFVTGETYTWTAPIVSPAGAITGGVGLAGQSSVAQTLINVTNTIVATATYNVISSEGINFQLVITVNPVPVVANVLSNICSGAAFNVVPSNVPANTTYTWTAPVVSPAGTVTGSSAQTVPQIFIGQTLTNPTVAKATVIYTVTPTAGACSGNPFLITVTDNPIPVLNNSSSSPSAICSGSSYSFSPATSTSGTTITWSRSAISGISNTASQGNSNPNEVLNNTTTAAITVNYIFKLSANSCTNDQSIPLIVNPKPALTSTLSAPSICSGNLFSYSPAAINTSNPTFAWTRSAVTGINGAVGGSGTNDPNEALVNSTSNALQVIYSYLVTDGSTACVSNAQVVRVTVNPVPNITNVSVSSCSGNVFTTPVSGAITGTLYTWAAPVQVSGGAITGGSAVSVGQYFIGQALSNNGTQGVVDYTVTPNANGCVGSNFKVTVTVTAAGTTAQLNNLAPPSICTGTTFNYPPASSSSVTSYTWTRYQTNGITPATNNGTGTILELLTNTSTVPLVANYAYTLATADGCTNTQLVPVTVNPIATLNSSLSPLPICSNTTFSYTPSSATAKTTFTWTRAAVTGISNGPASGIGNPNEILVNTTTSPVNVSYVYTLTPPSGCVSTQTVIVTVNPAPVLTSSLTPPAICSGATFTYSPTSNTSGMTFNWSRSAISSISNGVGTGVGNPAEILVNTSNSPVTVTYVYSLSANGCSNIQNVNVIVNPTPNIANLTAASCSNTAFTVTPPNVPAGTQYTWISPVINPAGSITNGSTVSTLQNSVSQTLTNATANPAIATYTVTPVANGCTGPVFTLDVTVNNLPLLTSSLTPPAICSNKAFNYTPSTALAGTSFAWTRAAVSGISNATSSGINNPNETLINTTTSTVPVIYQYVLTSSAGCVSAAQNVTVQINAAASLTSSLSPPAICSGATFNYTPLSGTTGAVYNWTRDIQTSFSNGASSGTGNPAEILINTGTTPASVSYVYTLTANGCTNTQIVSVVVNPTPVVPAQLASICGGNAFTINPTGVPAGTQYTWTAPVINPALSVLGSSAQSVLQNSVGQTLSNITNNVATATYTVVPTANGCTGGSFNIVVTVNPSPVLTSSAAPSAVCSNAVFTYNPVSTISGTSFSWTRAAVTGISNGVANGINNPNETLVNKTSAAVSVIYQYILTSPSGCVSSVQNVTVQINPAPVLSSNPTPPAICSGSTFNYTPLSATALTGFSWTRDVQTSINNTTSSGTGNPGEILINTGTAAANVSYTYTLTANGCSNTQIVTVVVNPTPVIPSQLAAVCTGNAFSVNPVGVPSGTQYIWTAPVINPTLSISGTSSQAVPQNTIGQTLTNNTSSIATATYTVTPSANGCTGNSFNLAVTVNPAPVLTSNSAPAAVCSNAIFNYIPSSNVTGTGYTWSRAVVSNISNVASSGTNNINETLVNTSSSSVTVLYSYVLSSPSGCTSAPQTVTVQVNPLPVLTSSLNPSAICSGAVFNYTPATSSGTASFVWTRAVQTSLNNPATSGTGSPGETLINTSTGIVQVSYLYTITLNGCTNTQTVNVNVNPVASISSQLSTICSGTAFTIKPSGTPSGTQYTWGTPVINPVSSLTGGSAVTIFQNSISQTLTNSTGNDATAIYTVTPSTNGCTGASFTVAITVNPIPVLNSTQTPVAICSNSSFNYTPTSTIPGTSFLWTRASVTGISNASASGSNNPYETLTNLTGNAVSVVYSYAITTPNGYTNTQSVTVSVNPIPVLNNITPSAICSGSIFNYIPVSSIAGSGFTWSRLQNNFISNPATSGTGNPAEVLVNTSNNTVNVNYDYTITSPIGCVNKQSVILPVNPSPNISNLSVVSCNNTSFTVSPSNAPAGTLYTWALPIYSPVGSVTGGTSQSVGQNSINQTLINQTLNPAIVTYTVVPSFNGCTGSSFSVAVTVNNTTILSSSLSAPAVCSNSIFSYTPTSNTAGTSFAWTRSVVNGISNPATSGTGNPAEALINITTQPVQVSYNYTLNTTNGCLNTQTVTVQVNPTPVLSSTLAPPAICSGAAFNYTPASVFAGATYSWSRSVMPFISNGAGSGSGIVNPSEVLVNTTINPVTVPYSYIITSNGCSNTQTVNVIVNPTPNVPNQLTTICGSTSFAVSPANVPVGTQYIWSAPSVNPTGSVNGGTAQTILQNSIGQLLINQTLSTGIATYTVTPVANGCTGVNFSVAVSVKPTPVIPNQQIAAVCSGTSFSFVSPNVPAGGTSYSWSSPIISPQGSLTGGSGQSLLQNAVSQTLSSTNNLTNTATYSVIPVTAGCVGNTFSLTVPVNPVPVVADLVDTICSGGTFSIVPSPVPANTIYTWNVPTSLPNASLIGGKSQTTGVSVISQSLQIAGNTISQALYSITPSALGCVGNPFNLTETVGAPLAAIKNSNALICSGTSFDLTPLNAPANTTYTWAIPIDNPIGAASGYSAQSSRQTKINQTLTNLISKPVTVVYSVVPFNTGCTGATFTASVTVSPVPKSAISGKPVVCRDPFDTLTVNFVGTAPWSFSYLDNGVAKNVTGITANPFTWVLPSLPVAPTRIVEITLVNDRACVDSVDTAVIIQKVNPLPVGQIVSLHGNNICNNIPDTLFVSYPLGDTFKYQWTRNGVAIPGGTGDTLTTLSAGYYNAVLNNQFGCIDTASPPVTLNVIGQPKINFTYDAYCINTLIRFTNLTDTTLIGQTRWTWDLGDSTTSNSFHTSNSYVKAGNRHIRLTATQLYCQAYNTSFDSTINIEFPITGIRLPSVSAYKGVFTPIADRTVPNYKYLWTPTRGIDFPDRSSVNFNFQATQEYLINLTSPAGCVTTDSVLVRVFDDKLVDIMVPKSFTPNGDGTNDVLFAYLAGIKTFQYFKVYNRQGKLIFETTNPDAGWNGMYNGSPLPMGIYIWATSGIALDGTMVQKTGQTVLMR